MLLRHATLAVAGMLLAGLCCVLAANGCGRKEPAAEKPSTSETQVLQTGPASEDPPPAQTVAENVPPAEASPSPPPNADTATTQPGANEGVPPFQPLADAEVGEWVHLATLSSRELRYEIVRVGAATVATQVTALQDGKPLGLPTVREDMRNWDPLAAGARGDNATRSVSRGTIETAGYSWDALIYEDRWTDEGVAYIRRTWVHPEAPVLGSLRMELIGNNTVEARLELKAFGRRGGQRGPAEVR